MKKPKEEIDLRKATWKDVQKLSVYEFDHFKRIFEEEEERRNEPEFELIEAIYFDDGCEGWYMTMDDFEEKAREKDKYGYDLMDIIINTLVEHYGHLTITKEKFTKESFHNVTFWGKENPYQEELDKLEEEEEDDE